MLAFARPELLAAGLAAALLPLLLHLVARRPPERVPLPTARFLAPDARTAVRLRRRPTDLLLLALRMLLLALLGAAAAGPAWLPRQRGTAELVLLDRSAGMDAAAWSSAVGAARGALLAPDGAARGGLVLFDGAAAAVPSGSLTPALFDSLAAAGPGDVPPDYAAALRSVPAAARGLRGADSVRVTMLSALRGDGWRPGLSVLRRAAWPGAIRLPDLPSSAPPSGAADPGSPSPGRAVVHAAGEGGRYVAAALGATGWEVRTPGDPADLHVLLAPPDAPAAARVRAAVDAGATAVVPGGAAAGLRDVLPWEPGAPPSTDGGVLVLDDGTRLSGAGGRTGGGPSAGSRLLAAWEDGRPAASAHRVGRGCVVYLATEPESGSLPLSAAFPRAVDRLARGCGEVEERAGGAPLDSGARAVLRGSGAETVAAASLSRAGGGVPLGRWVLGAALAAALVETALAYGTRRTT